MNVPASLQSVILSRVDRLETGEKRYLQAAAVLGRLFYPHLVSAMHPERRGSPSHAGGVGIRGSWFIRNARQPEPEYSFHHVLVRDAIYQDLPRGYRVDLHRRAAQAIETLYADDLPSQVELLAHHYDLGDDAAKAITYLIQAGKKTQATYLNQEAQSYFEQALKRLAELEPSDPRSEQWVVALHGLGEIHETLGNLAEADATLRRAIALAADLALPPRRQAHIIMSLCRFLAATGDNPGLVEQCNQGLSLIDGQDAPMELVAFTTYLSKAAANRGQWRLGVSHFATIVDLLPQLDYSAYLIDAYFWGVLWCRFTKQVQWGFELTETAIASALRQHDYWSASQLSGPSKLFLHETTGNSALALACVVESRRYAEMAGNELMIRGSTYWLGVCHGWMLGNLDEGERYARLDLQTRGEMFQPASYVFTDIVLGLIQYCRHNWSEALAALERAHRLATEDQFRVDGVRRGRVGLAWTYFMVDRKADGLALLSHIAAEEELHIESWPTVACALAGLEAMCADADEYEIVQHQIMAAREEEPLPLVQWRLTPAKPDARFEDDDPAHKPGFSEKPGLSGWTWHDQFGDCSYREEDDALTICAANCHDLWLNNFAAPRLLQHDGWRLRSRGGLSARPMKIGCRLGGLLLWQDRENYLRLTWNTLSPAGIELLGCVENVDGLFGIGHLPGADRVFLRLERIGSRVRALCSADGDIWYSAGEVDFPIDDPAGKSARKSVEVGPLAIGMIHRYVHAGAWPDGTAIRFESLRLVL